MLYFYSAISKLLKIYSTARYILLRRTILFVLTISMIFIIAFSGCDSNEYIVIEPKYHPPIWNIFPLSGSHGVEGLAKGIVDCYKCHGHDLSGGIAESACSECHGNDLDDCTACHGGLIDSTGAPPYALSGATEDTTLAVGAHSSHVSGSVISDGVPCGSCHIVPEHPWDTTHFDFSIYDGPGTIDSVAEVIWGEFENGGGSWSRETKSCSNTYCHGNFYNGYTDNSPIWTEPDQALCTSCHDDGTKIIKLGRGHIIHHFQGVDCEGCHAATVATINEENNIIGPQFHVNGQIEIKFITDIGIYFDGSCSDMGDCHRRDETYYWD